MPCSFCRDNDYGPWKVAISAHICDKGLIMSFLHWICQKYVLPRRKRSKKKTLNQYWRDFRLLYRRANEGKVVNANDRDEILKASHDQVPTPFVCILSSDK